MVNDKSKANLRRGNPRNKGNKKGRAASGETWADLIIAYGETVAPKELLAIAGLPDKTQWKLLVVAAAYRQAATGNAAILRELMQRSEPQDPLIMNIDLTKLSTEQLERLADGEDPRTVIFASAGGD